MVEKLDKGIISNLKNGWRCQWLNRQRHRRSGALHSQVGFSRKFIRSCSVFFGELEGVKRGRVKESTPAVFLVNMLKCRGWKGTRRITTEQLNSFASRNGRWMMVWWMKDWGWRRATKLKGVDYSFAFDLRVVWFIAKSWVVLSVCQSVKQSFGGQRKESNWMNNSIEQANKTMKKKVFGWFGGSLANALINQRKSITKYRLHLQILWLCQRLKYSS